MMDYLELAQTWGFPALMCFYFMFQINKTLQKQTQAFYRLCEAIENLKLSKK